MRKGNATKIFRKASEASKQQLEVLNNANNLESSRKEKAQKEFIDTVEKVTDRHESALKLIVDNEKETIKNINSAEKATEAIKKKLEE